MLGVRHEPEYDLFGLADIGALVGDDQRALEAFALIDAEIGRQLHRAAHARRHIDERSVGEHRRIERGEGIVADRHRRSEILLHQFGSEIGMKRMPALASSALTSETKSNTASTATP